MTASGYWLNHLDEYCGQRVSITYTIVDNGHDDDLTSPGTWAPLNMPAFRPMLVQDGETFGVQTEGLVIESSGGGVGLPWDEIVEWVMTHYLRQQQAQLRPHRQRIPRPPGSSHAR